jgi:hypothetical protein
VSNIRLLRQAADGLATAFGEISDSVLSERSGGCLLQLFNAITFCSLSRWCTCWRWDCLQKKQSNRGRCCRCHACFLGAGLLPRCMHASSLSLLSLPSSIATYNHSIFPTSREPLVDVAIHGGERRWAGREEEGRRRGGVIHAIQELRAGRLVDCSKMQRERVGCAEWPQGSSTSRAGRPVGVRPKTGRPRQMVYECE